MSAPLLLWYRKPERKSNRGKIERYTEAGRERERESARERESREYGGEFRGDSNDRSKKKCDHELTLYLW